ncbi:histidine phosphatase family protein [Thalassospira xiamenensis]|uniref:histidine phosphatase family protein n=1 Tax=Thalassospira xiamenensis TaxID=220697 RepID=UPI003AA80FBA
MSSFHFALLRHGVTAWNAERRIQGQSDIPLLPETVDEYRGLQLPQKWCVVPWRVSPLIRTIQTADALAIDGVSPDEHWIEMNWGDWEGKKLSDLRRQLGPRMQENEDRGWDFRPEGGESPREVLSRVEAALAGHRDGDFGVVTHKGVIRAVYAAASGWDMLGKIPARLDWKSIHVFSWSSDDGLGVVDLNCRLLERGGTTS